jgi:small neutral amino acid transporter SnatA (MarC family)
MIGPAAIFTLLFVMLGPLKILGPFANRTRGMDVHRVRQIAVWAFVVASIAAIGGGFVGRALLANWHVSRPALTLAGGIIFFVVALRQLLEQYEPTHTAAEPLPESPIAAACRLVFPILLTPYGIAAVIALLAGSTNVERTLTIVGLVVFVMVLNLVAMLFARFVLIGFTTIVLQVVAAVLAVLQVALAIEFVFQALRMMRVLET